MLTTVLEVQANGTRELACGHSLFAPSGPQVGGEIDCPAHEAAVESAPQVRPPTVTFEPSLEPGTVELLDAAGQVVTALRSRELAGGISAIRMAPPAGG